MKRTAIAGWCLLLIILCGNSAVAADVADLAVLADSLEEASDFDSAIVVASAALSRAEKTGGIHDTIIADLLSTLANCRLPRGQYAEADTLRAKALDLYERVLGPNHPKVAIGLARLAVIRVLRRDFTTGAEYIKRALLILEKSPAVNDVDRLTILAAVASYYWETSQFAEAEQFCLRARELAGERSGKYAQVATKTAVLQAAVYLEQGRYWEAKELLQNTLDRLDRSSPMNRYETARCLYHFGRLYVRLDKTAEAESMFRRAAAIWEERLDPEFVGNASCLYFLGLLQQRNGRADEAEQTLLRSMTMYEKTLGPDCQYIGTVLNILGNSALQQDDFIGAESYARRMLEFYERTQPGAYPFIIQALRRLITAYQFQGRMAEASPHVERALKIYDSLFLTGPEDHRLMDLCQLLEAGSSDSADWEKSERDFGIRYGRGISFSLTGVLDNMWTFYRWGGRASEAVEVAKCASLVLQREYADKIGIANEREALLMTSDLWLYLNSFLTSYFDLPTREQPLREDAAVMILSHKGQITDIMLESQKALWREDSPEIEALTDSLQMAKNRMAGLFVNGAASRSDESDPRVDSLDRVIGDIEARLARRGLLLSGVNFQQVSLPAIRQALPHDGVLLEFIVYNRIDRNGYDADMRYAVVVLAPTGECTVLDLGDASKIHDVIDQYRNHIERITSDVGTSTDSDREEYQAICNRLSACIWKPIEPYLRDRKRILISPDAMLHLVSFAGLLDENGRYLIEDYTIHYLSAARDLLRLEKVPSSGKGLYAVGDPDFDAGVAARLSTRPGSPPKASPLGPFSAQRLQQSCWELSQVSLNPLPGTRREIETVAGAWRRTGSEPLILRLGRDASEDCFKADAPGRRVIHLATHGYYLDCEPPEDDSSWVSPESSDFYRTNALLYSGLFLAGANLRGEGAAAAGLEDGILTAYEVSTLNLTGTDLVMLSACESGLGNVAWGEGMLGLVHAFRRAGVRTVISALWPVPDEATASMVESLYRGGNQSWPDALREAQLAYIQMLRATHRSDHPASWGGFISLGDWR